jgi:hypothetical protein
MKYYTEVGKGIKDLKLSNEIEHYSCGKEAITVLLKRIKLSFDDEVYVNSTFDTKYVSSCVTSTIFNFCKPSKVISEKTKLIFVIHDFGFPNEKVFELKDYANKNKIPLVEDCAQSAYSFFCNNKRIGTIGDYSIYSLKKILPYDNAGLLMESSETFPYLDEIHNAALRRRYNYNLLSEILFEYGITPCFTINEKISPYVFPFKISNSILDDKLHKLFQLDLIYWTNINIYSLPIHQNIRKDFFNLIQNL